MNPYSAAFFLLSASLGSAAALWDGGAGNGLFFTAGNWDDDVVPTLLSANPLFPTTAPNKQIDLGGNNIAHERVILQGGYRLFRGRVGVAGGGSGSEIESSGDNTLDASFGTFEWGNDVKLVQAAGGTLTVNGATSGFMKSLVLKAQGTIVISSTITPLASWGFYKEGMGTARFTSTSAINGAEAGRFVNAGRLLVNGTASAAAPWTVNGGGLGGTGTLLSSITAGASLGSVLAPGDPAIANGLGTLTVSGSVTLGDHAILEVELGAPGNSDRLALSGALNLGPRTGLWIKTVPGTSPAGSYTVVTHGGTRTGSFVLLDGPTGARIDSSVAGEIRLVIDPPIAPENIMFPVGAMAVNVTQAPYNAVPNDGLDDTAAIQAALNAFPNGRRLIYLPNGTYDISDTLNWPAGIPGWTDYKHTILQGQSRDGVVLRLKNNNPFFQNPSARRAMIFTGPAPAQRFGIMIRNLTVNSGTGNPGACGIQLNANNFGGMRQVKIASGDGQGVTGLDLAFTAEIGPLLVQDVEVDGFNYGVRTGDAINGIVLERLTVRHQNSAGILNSGQVFSVRSLTSVNAVPALVNGTDPFGGLDTGGACTLLDAKLIGLLGAENQSAITTSAFFYGRNIISSGYARILTKPTLSGNANLDGASLDEYQSRSVLTNFPSPNRSLQMPVEDPPTVPWDAPSSWVNVRSYGAIGDGSTDNTAAFQAAIDAGQPTVFVPPDGYFIVRGDVTLRGAVRRLTGTHANVGGPGRLLLGVGSAATVIIERASWPAIVQQSERTLIVSSSEAVSITSSSAGKLFIEDVVTDRLDLQNPRARVWARQLNTENGAATNVTNAGAALWVLGFKTERGQVKIATTNGGFTEVLGAHIYSTTAAKTTPLFTLDDAAGSFVCVAESNFEGTSYGTWIRENRGSTSNILASTSVPFRTSANGRALTLFAGFDGAPKRPLDVTANAIAPTSILLKWNDQSWDETGFKIERSQDGLTWSPLSTRPAEDTSFTDSTAAPGITYLYRLRSLNLLASSSPTPSVTVTTPTFFQSWLTRFGLAATADPNGDPDTDGLTFLQEYAFGGTPTSQDTALLPVPSITPSQLQLTYRRERAELFYLVETSSNLSTGSWSETGVSYAGSGLLRTASFAYGTASRRFIRLRLLQP